MARYPGATWRSISKTRATLQPQILCFHTMVGSLVGTDTYFRSAGVDSHFGVGNTTDGALDGKVYQWVDTSRVAYANLAGNSTVISIETADGGNPDRPWSPKALDALVKLGIWVCKTHNIPARLINGNEPGSRGIGYHRQGCDHSSSYRPRGWPYDQWRVSGGVKWSNAVGKTCPGNVRIKQLVDIVIPRIKAGVEGTTKEWWEMAIPDSEVDKIASAVWGKAIKSDSGEPIPLGLAAQYNYNRINRVLLAVGDLNANLAAAIRAELADAQVDVAEDIVQRATEAAVRKTLGGLDA